MSSSRAGFSWNGSMWWTSKKIVPPQAAQELLVFKKDFRNEGHLEERLEKSLAFPLITSFTWLIIMEQKLGSLAIELLLGCFET